MEDGSKSQQISTLEVGEDCWATIYFVVQGIRFAAKERHAGKLI